jgi:beta-glucanase (GH16 family)
LVWSDEFTNVGVSPGIINGQPAYSINPQNWAFQTGLINGGLQNYTNSIQNCYVQNDQLVLVAMQTTSATNNLYPSAMISSAGLQEFTYGKFAAKLVTPYGQGLWPAFWLVGDAWTQYQLYWPTVGEIDILEMIGGHQWGLNQDSIAYGHVHWNNASNVMSPLKDAQAGIGWSTPDGSMLHNNSLVYWAEWNQKNIAIGVNELTYFNFNTINISGSINPVDAFHGKWPFYLLLNIAVGGSWPGSPDNSTIWPQKMIVDWVRVYQQKTPVNGNNSFTSDASIVVLFSPCLFLLFICIRVCIFSGHLGCM